MLNSRFLLITFLINSFVVFGGCQQNFLRDKTTSEMSPERLQALAKIRQGLDKRAKSSNFESLHSTHLSSGDVEIRFWIDGRKIYTYGVILKKEGANWSAFYLPAVVDDSDEKTIIIQPEMPLEEVWEKLKNAGILTFPDEQSTHGNIICTNCPWITIETNYEGKYRIYRYRHPCIEKVAEAKKLAMILDEMSRIFNIEFYRCKGE